MRLLAAVFLSLALLVPSTLHSQIAVTTQALFRTFMIQTTHGRGTVFSIDVDNREYWITAKHVFNGVENGPVGTFTEKSVTADILSQSGDGDDGHDQHWSKYHFTTIDPGKDVDILVLVPDNLLLQNYKRDFTLKTGAENAIIGGECEFLGFPYGGGWKSKLGTQWVWLPFIKHCGLSGQISQNGLDIWILDGINNHGFSGGPVVIGGATDQKVFAVISGYHTEPLDVIPDPVTGEPMRSPVPPAPLLSQQSNGGDRKKVVEANSGFILAFDIDAAIKAIRANPIGPLRPEPVGSSTSK